jgi:DNA repair protein SbcC/Rad50
MRPVRLELEGFTAFRSPTVIDFTGADLFALAGPTGAGKTSIIDALTFALYGSVPRLVDRRAVAPVISQNLTEARVRLDFTVGDAAYTAVRVVRATRSGATTKEARLQRGDDVLAGTAAEVSDAVTALLGLPYEHFTTCVSLPQGQFADFLHAEPRRRQDLLVRLLDLGLYERVAGAARQRAALARNRVDVAGGQLERLAGATPEARVAAAARVDELATLEDRLAKDRPQVEDRLSAAADARVRVEAVAAQVALLDGLAVPEGVRELAAELAEADRVRRRCAALDAEAQAAVADAEADLATLPERATLAARRDDHARRSELAEALARGEVAEAEAADTLTDAEAAVARARAALAAATDERERVRVALRAQALVPELVAGEACPVCGQTVTELPDHDPPGDLASAERAVADADKALSAATAALTRSQTQQARVDEKLARVRADLAAVIERLAGAPDAETVERDLALVDAAVTALDKARQAERDARRAVAAATERHDAVRAREVESRRAFDAARDRVAALGPPPAERRDLAADWTALVDWAATRTPALVEQLAEHRHAADAARRDAVERVAAVIEACRHAGVDVSACVDVGAGSDGDADPSGGSTRRTNRGRVRGRHRSGSGARGADSGVLTVIDDPSDASDAAAVVAGEPGALLAAWPGEAVVAARARAEQAVVRIDEDLAAAEGLRSEQRAATADQQVADLLATHLAANRFEKWLLDEALHQLVAGASTILDELSAGAYALAVDARSGGFGVVDHTNASQVRSARTLSGGETFLASLALALALADQVAGLAASGAARLEALFLDEGFGTLDPDTLDIVAAALDELGARGRMVGVVTHVRELAERLPVRFEVRKAAGAAVVERVDS